MDLRKKEFLKILVLWSHTSGYLEDSICAVAEKGVEVHLVYAGIDTNSPFQKRDLPSGIYLYNKTGLTTKEINILKQKINPKLVLMSGWNHRIYRKLERLDSEKWVICFDTQLRFSLRHVILVIISRVSRQFRTDYAFVPGERQFMLAQFMGFKKHHVRKGLYAIDSKKYFHRREEINREFLFVGRLVAEKGITVLLHAYNKYRVSVSAPWDLRICGEGPLFQSHVSQGIIWDGFVQPEMLVKKFQNAGVFVLPSLYEPWGVVISEAAASGLPIIASVNCGAVSSLLVDNWNGKIIHEINVESILQSLLDFHNMDPNNYFDFAQNSVNLSSQIDVSIFAQVILSFLEI